MPTHMQAPQGIDPTRLAPLEPDSGGNDTTLGQKSLTKEEKCQCPSGDTRWPPPNVSMSKPLHLLSDKGEKPIYYHLIHENSSPQVDFWKGPLKAQATAAYAKKGLALQISKEGKSKKELKAAKEKAFENEALKAKMEIMQARNTKMLKELSNGPRGTIWQLDDEHLHVWRCIEVVQKVNGAVSLSAERREIFYMFGGGLKGIDGDMLLVSQEAEVPS
ncbi:uncharacterized protein ALTATR162_LOCUS11862 [Alternaria atra]|uniref:Uncharacterized protein n=1 Tax=Alternaria atra TaxID=119953 RepID=A0A8J2IPP0_9PLEO|nr:uncharacterized protein ALTATR162_LOCUS11862 [Alternaria atra]CAG5188077.1 unnamed protein product [Alternaria atra]